MTDRPESSGDWVALNADVVGYSALVADDVEATTEAMSEYRELVEATVADNQGTLASFVGDSFMAIFAEPMAALRTAITVTKEIEARNAPLPKSRHVRFRLGMDQGAIRFADGNHHGDALNIAARIQAIAPAGGLAVSGRVYRELDEPALRFRAMGAQALKNIPERTLVYEYVGLPSDGATDSARRTLSSLDTPTLAVLPVITEMVDDAVRSAAGMIRRDLLHRISSVPGLKVVDAHTEPGGEGPNSASYMLESGVHQFGDQVHVFVALFDIATMNVVKSHKWATPASDLFALSDTIAEEVVRTIEVDLVVGEPARLYATLDDPKAIEKVYLGWYYLRNDTKEGWQRAREFFGDVAESHPDKPYGHVLLAFANWLGAAMRFDDDVGALLRAALEGARRADRGGDPTGMSQAVESAALMSLGRVDDAMNRLENLEDVRPTCDITYGLAGSVLRYLGHWERAVEQMDLAMRLTGINKPWYPTVKSCSLFVGGKVEEAAALAEGVLEHQPNNLEALLVLTASQVELGLMRRARATGELIRERFPNIDVNEWLDNTPFATRDIVARWKQDLAAAAQPA